MSQSEIEILRRALFREKTTRKQAEKILEVKSLQLFNTGQELEEVNEKLAFLLEEKTTQLQGVFENINDAYLIMNLKGDVLKMNNAAIDLFGYDVKKERLNVVDLIYKADFNYAFNSFKELRKKGSFTDYTARIITRNKTIRSIHLNATIIYDKTRKPIAAQGIIRDITESKRTAELIEEQKKELDVIVANSSLGIVLTNRSGNIRRTNEAMQKSLGYTENELSKLAIKDITFIEDFPESENHLLNMDSGEIDNFVVDKRYKKKDGSVLWAKTNVNAVRDNSGNILSQVALVEDITSKREKSLIIDMINDVAITLLGKTNIYEIAWVITNNIATYLNSEDCVIYLVDQKTATLEQIAAYGEKVDDKNQIINKITLPIGKGIVGTVAKTGKAERIKNTALDDRYILDKIKRSSEITVPIMSDGRVIGLIDSEHIEKNYYTKEHLKTLESIANLVAMKLKSAINFRERQKAEAKNAVLRIELEKSNDELHEYAHIVSHDLKSPLRSISALVTWIKEDNFDNFDDKSLQKFDLIGTTLDRMELLISDILSYSSIGSAALNDQEVDLNLLVNNLKEVLYVPEHITITVLNKLPTIKGDKTKLQQLYLNLLSNAIKFIDKEQGLIKINVEERASFYLFSIQDNGVGIHEKYHDKIFKIFHSLRKSKESTGIGLSIVKKIVNLHNGEIWLDSKPNIGSTFYFTLKK
jgi:PAS domain S-box-containing protein